MKHDREFQPVFSYYKLSICDTMGFSFMSSIDSIGHATVKYFYP